MTAPLTLTLVRHGESESNKAKHATSKGVKVPREDELMKVHTSERRLTDRGIEQAKQAGVWLRANWLPLEGAKRCYVSPYVRAAETAGHFGLGQEWRIDSRLCERNWGELDQLTHAERMKIFANGLTLRKERAFFWAPDGGESLQSVFGRLRDMTTTLHRECSKMHVLVTSHGETMYAWRYLNEYWIPEDLRNAMRSTDKRFDIFNCRIVQYSRLGDHGEVHEKFTRVRFIDPSYPDDQDSNHGWMPFKRTLWSEADLLSYAERHPQFLSEFQKAS